MRLPQPPPLGRIFAAGAALILVYFVLHAFVGVAQTLLLGFFGVLLAITIDVPTTRLAKHMPRGLALPLVLLALVALIAGSVVLIVPRVSQQLTQLALALPRGVTRAGALWARISPGEALTWPTVRGRVVTALPSLASRLLPFVNTALSVLTSVLVLVAVALFVSIDPRAELRWMVRVVPPRHEVVFWRLAGRLGNALRQWLLGTIVTLLIVATFTGVGLLVIGVPSWLALALLTFVTGFVPYLGALVTGIVVLGAGLAVSAKAALAALIVFIVGQTLQGVLIAPVVNRHALQMPPALLLTSQLVMAGSFGVLGLLAAQPLLAVAIVVVEDLWVERTLGRAPSAPNGGGAKRRRDAERRHAEDHAVRADEPRH